MDKGLLMSNYLSVVTLIRFADCQMRQELMSLITLNLTNSRTHPSVKRHIDKRLY